MSATRRARPATGCFSTRASSGTGSSTTPSTGSDLWSRANESRVSDGPVPSFRPVPRTGVIFVVSEAGRLGYKTGDPSWANLGQGMPETGPLPGGPPRVPSVPIDPADQEYAPVAGLLELREAVAELYNARYRKGLPSRYTAENVCIAGGGRAALTRVAAALGSVNLGHFLPDYTAYEELLDIFRNVAAIPILRDPERGYAFDARELKREILGRGLGALLASNPNNPTGACVEGPDLAGWIEAARELDCALILDEFYSHYAWNPADGGGLPLLSAARFVSDVDKDPVVILDGLTKNWRYPGWRVAWIVGPRSVIDAVSSAGSFLDGGGSRPLQRAAVDLLAPKHADAEAASIQRAFRAKRDWMAARLTELGVRLDGPPQGTFYCWGSVAGLPAPLNTGMGFFRAGLDAKVITVPGEFFDVNPGKRRAARGSRFRGHVRFSFGPPEAVVRAGLERLESVIHARRPKAARKP
ncbi:MAG: aminotransferase class I/II-fold pyridoxal phosphate-dependent enzyme [Elusimicrobia bacterium]|nr:aminotransferase class I/II-fold pyridoxal phosphate-dependent enzyme [Elusimicrobiota bacterium]